MNFTQYLNRIKYTGALDCNLHTLSQLQAHHLLAIPFENIDIQNGVPILLNTTAFYHKIVLNDRGGYCYELNGLFHQLLLHLNFDAHLISARVVKGHNYGPEFDHLAIIVTLDGKQYLTDVGFGDFSFKPLLIDTTTKQDDGRNEYQIQNIEKEGIDYLSVGRWKRTKKKYITDYYFTTTPRQLEDFADMNTYHQTSPHSHFTQNLICSLPNTSGRISLINYQLIVTQNDERYEIHLHQQDIEPSLEKYFKVSTQLVTVQK